MHGDNGAYASADWSPKSDQAQADQRTYDVDRHVCSGVTNHSIAVWRGQLSPARRVGSPANRRRTTALRVERPPSLVCF